MDPQLPKWSFQGHTTIQFFFLSFAICSLILKAHFLSYSLYIHFNMLFDMQLIFKNLNREFKIWVTAYEAQYILLYIFSVKYTSYPRERSLSRSRSRSRRSLSPSLRRLISFSLSRLCSRDLERLRLRDLNVSRSAMSHYSGE